jgi:GTP-binding protein
MNSIAIIGRPNVGKSSLFNKLTNSRKSIVSEFEGLTRDRQSSLIKIDGTYFEIVDSGGLNYSNKDLIFNKEIISQTNQAADEADLIFFMVDYKAGLVADDVQISKLLRKKDKPICLIINKVDGVNEDIASSEFYKLGYSDIICTSIVHNYGIDLIKEYILNNLEGVSEAASNTNDLFKIAVIGKPNAGKSTFINSVIGSQRLIATEIPGTTIDSIDIEFEWNNEKIILVDTAGIRRKGKVTQKEEKFALLKSLETARVADFIFFMIDSTEGITSQDQGILTEALKSYKPMLILFNKWDLLDEYHKERFEAEFDKFIRNFSFVEHLKISAQKKTNLNKVFKKLLEVRGLLKNEFKTSMLNNLLSDALINHPPSISKGIRPKIKFTSFMSRNPLAFKLHGNHLEAITPSYKRYLEKYFRQTLNLKSIPLKLVFENSNNPYEDRAKKISTGLVTRRKNKNKLRDKLSKKTN